MLIDIKSDVFFIAKRLKEIDDGYFVVFNTQTQKFEVHNSKQKQTFCFSVKEKELNSKTIDLALKTRRENFDKLMREIEQHNNNLESENNRKIKDMSTWKFKEIFDYSKRHIDADINNAYKTKWA